MTDRIGADFLNITDTPLGKLMTDWNSKSAVPLSAFMICRIILVDFR